MNNIVFHLDSPQPDQPFRGYRIPVSGWTFTPDVNNTIDTVSAWVSGVCIGETRLFFDRPDVNAHLGLAGSHHTGFEMRCALQREVQSVEPTDIDLIVRLHLRSGAPPITVASAPIIIQADDIHELPHGFILISSTEQVLHREDVYLMGPSSDAVNTEVLSLIDRYLPPRGMILDVGCGSGPYARPLMKLGYDWLGIDVKQSNCDKMRRLGLRHEPIEPGKALPFEDHTFDGTICLEVLEHIERTDFFLSEISRVSCGRALFSVPNSELIPLCGPAHVIPRHMLEPDHKNFFTRFSLGALLKQHFDLVEVIDYAPLPIGSLINEVLPNHLFAVAGKSAGSSK